MRSEPLIALGLAAALAFGAQRGVNPEADEPTFDIGVIGPVVLADGSRGCDVTISASNSGPSNLAIDASSQVRAKPSLSPQFGTWKKLWGSKQYVRAGQKWSDVVRLDLGCSYVRQYRFVVQYAGNEKAFTYPSSGGTKSEDVGLGNLYTKFFD